MSISLKNSQLGKKSFYQSHYNPNLLFPIKREIKRKEIGVDPNNTGFYGYDMWTHYEISWLNEKGKPRVAIGELYYPASSISMIESKSMKLYFNSFNHTKFSDECELIKTVINDISKLVEAPVSFRLINIEANNLNIYNIENALCLDGLDINCDIYQPFPEFLCCDGDIVCETLYTNLLKSNCLVTNQPDWGTIFIEYSGNKINYEGLLKYVISLRNHNEFHEQCVERVFTDINKYCKPSFLTVYARYTRRGGIDINPYRTSKQNFEINNLRLIRQ